MTLIDLHNLISLVCPIEGINSEGAIWFKPEATDTQKEQAMSLMEQNLSSLVSGAI